MRERTNVPMRRCCGCGKSFPKSELIRIAGRDGRAVIDMADRESGRGIYLCRSLDCIAMADKKKAVGRSLHMDLDGETVSALLAAARAMLGGEKSAEKQAERSAEKPAKVDSYLGFAARARKIVSGSDTCSISMKKGSAKLVIVAADAAENTKEKLQLEASRSGVPFRIYGNGDHLSKMTGKSGRTVFAVTDEHFAECILAEIEKEVF